MPTMVRLNSYPNVSFRNDNGQMTPRMGWSKCHPNDSLSKDAGQTIPIIGRSKSDSSRKEEGITVRLEKC